MSVTRWSAYAPTAIAEMLAEIGRVDPEGLEAIEADLALGGTLRLVVDQPHGPRIVRVRLRLMSQRGYNRWIIKREYEAEPPRPRIVGR